MNGTGGTGAIGAGGAGGTTGGGGFLDDAGAKACPDVPNTPAMIAVPAWGGKSYCIDATEVTNLQYAAWLDTAPDISNQVSACSWNTSFEPPGGPPPQDDRPVGWVDWCDAQAYCKAAGKRLCGRVGGGPAPFFAHEDFTVNQWYNACTHGGTLVFPYGQTYSAAACNVKEAGFGATLTPGSLPSCEGGFTGIFDMSGNVWEWEDSCVPSDAGTDVCRRRGGSFSSTADNVSCGIGSSRPMDNAESNTGFRCCAD